MFPRCNGVEHLTKEWYSIQAVWRFSPGHISWICEHYELLLAGKWPEKKTGYIDSPFDGRTQVRPRAYFENTINLIAEFHWRIDQCGDDGKLFRAFRLGKFDFSLLRSITGKMDEEWVERRCKRVRDYIKGIGKAGLDRRHQRYDDFCRHWWIGFGRADRP